MSKIDMVIERADNNIFTIKLLDANDELLRLFFAVETEKDEYVILDEFHNPIEDEEPKEFVDRIYERFFGLINYRKTFGISSNN